MAIFDNAPDAVLVLRNLALAATAGFVVGFEREWTQTSEKRRHTFAGARTFALIGMTGGLAGLLDDGALIAAAALVVIGALTIVGYWIETKEAPGRGGTTEIAIFATLLLGVAAGRGALLLAAAGAVAVAGILSLKPFVSQWARSLTAREIHATLRFLAISVLVLPVLPDESLGPYGALNPRTLWLMVVLISGLSFLGYWLVKFLGGGRGVLVTGIVGGLASSTATTLSLAQFARDRQSAPSAVAAGIVAANVVMLARVGILLAALSPATLSVAAPALVAAGVVGAAIALAIWRAAPKDGGGEVKLGNPFEIKPALYFATLIALISVLSAYGADRFGAAGIYAIGFISGLADIDAMTLSASRQAATGSLLPDIAAGAILLAAIANIMTKAIMALTIGGRAAGLLVIAAFAIIIAAGAFAFLAL